MEITRALFQTGRGYTESFCVYGENLAFEWPQVEEEDYPVIFTRHVSDDLGQRRGTPTMADRVHAPDRRDLLPPEIARFTVPGKYDDTNPQKAF